MRRNFIIQIDDEVRDDLRRVAEGGHMDDTKYAAVWIKELSTIRPEFALKVLGLIPAEWKHRRPGRPAGATTPDRKDGTVPKENVAKDVA